MGFYNVIYRFISQLESRKKLLSSSPESNPETQLKNLILFSGLQIWSSGSLRLSSQSLLNQCQPPIEVHYSYRRLNEAKV